MGFEALDIRKVFEDGPPSKLDCAIGLVESAYHIIKATREPKDRADSITWRLADALAMLQECERDLPGCHHRTGRGSIIDAGHAGGVRNEDT